MLAVIVCMIPEDFDLVDYMSIKESAGIFNMTKVDLKNLKLVAQSVSTSFLTVLNTGININEIQYFVSILDDLKVILLGKTDLETRLLHRGIDNRGYENESETHIFILINLFHLPSEEKYTEVKDSMELLERYRVPKELLEELKHKV